MWTTILIKAIPVIAQKLPFKEGKGKSYSVKNS